VADRDEGEGVSVRWESIEGTTWPADVGELEWLLRYAPEAVRPKTAASVVAAYGYLTDPAITQTVAIAALKRARAAQIVTKAGKA
jgi:hypothetical protein